MLRTENRTKDEVTQKMSGDDTGHLLPPNPSPSLQVGSPSGGHHTRHLRYVCPENFSTHLIMACILRSTSIEGKGNQVTLHHTPFIY